MHVVTGASVTRLGFTTPSLYSVVRYETEVLGNSRNNQSWKRFCYESKYKNIYSDGVPSLQIICIRLLQTYIIHTAEISWYALESQNPSNQTAMKDALEYLTDQVIQKCPPVYLDEICSTIIDCIEYLITNGYLVKRFTTILLNAKIRKLDLYGRPKEVQRAVYCRLDGLTKLELLAIKRNRQETDFNQFPIEGLVLTGVKKMTNLETFAFHDRCNDSIVIAAVQNCPRLKSIDVFGSEKVTDACTKHLAKLQTLQEINLSETSVTRDGFVNILLGCPQLFEIGDFKQIWDSVLKVRLKGKKLNVTHIREELDCARHLSALESCPNLTYLHLDCKDYDGQILKIENLQSLEELIIDRADFSKNGIGQYLAVRGENLEKLTFRDCTSVDLEWIGRTCPNLKSLFFLKVPVQIANPWKRTYRRRMWKHWKDVILLITILLVVFALTATFIWLRG